MSILGYQTNNFYGLKLVRIFHHDSHHGYFKTLGDALFSPKNKQKFSVLGSLNKDLKINDVYEFVLEYPNEAYLLHWNQTKNPIETTTDIGYKPIHVDSKLSSFQGLSRSSDKTRTLLDGSPSEDINNWWYSVGTITDEFKPNFPGFISSGEYYRPHLVNLWIRVESYDIIKTLPTLSSFVCTCKKYKRQPSFAIIITMMMFS